MHRGDNEEAVGSPEAQAEIAGDVSATVLPSQTLSSLDRIGIYRDQYVARLMEALETDYPALRRYYGEQVFYAMVDDYVHQYPSRSYTLNRLGDHLPEYLSRRPALHDLARLEYAACQVFDAGVSPVLTAEQVAAVPPDAWDRARLRPIEAFRLLSFRYSVREYLKAVYAETPAPPLRRKNVYVAIARPQYTIRHLDLERPAFELLSKLVDGVPLGDAIVSTPRATEAKVFEWFREWIAEGVFQAVDL